MRGGRAGRVAWDGEVGLAHLGSWLAAGSGLREAAGGPMISHQKPGPMHSV